MALNQIVTEAAKEGKKISFFSLLKDSVERRNQLEQVYNEKQKQLTDGTSKG